MESISVEQPTIQPEPLVDLKALSAHFKGQGIATVWLRRLANEGVLPCLRMGPRTLYKIGAVEQKLAELASTPSPKAKAPKAKAS